MPRAKPLTNKPESKPVRLLPGDVRALADCLYLRDKAARGKMAEDVKALLTSHRQHIERDGESAARKVETFKPLLKHALALRDGVQALPQGLRMVLCGFPDEQPISDAELERLVRALAVAVGKNAGSAEDGRPSGEEMLRQTVWGLQHIFATHYNGPNDEQTRQEVEFVHLALNAAGIPHPDPNNGRNRHRLTALMLPRS